MKRETARAIAENLAVGAAAGRRGMKLDNSLADVVNAVAPFGLSNLTSFNPIIQNSVYAPLTLNWQALIYAYKTHGIIQTAIEVPVLDALRGGLELQSQKLDSDDLKEIKKELEDGILDVVAEAFTWARLFGGAGIILNTGQDPEEPLSVRELKRIEFYAANRWEIVSTQRYADYYQFYKQRLHHSRVLTIAGKTAPYILGWQLQGWGMSEVERMLEDLNLFWKTRNVLYELLEEAKVDIYQFENFTQQLVSGPGTNITTRRIELMNQLKSYRKALVMDKNDTYEQKQITFSGLAEVMKENRMGIASALRIPLTKLFGMSASGFNSGEDDIENYNAMVESEVRQKMRRPLKQILDLLVRAKFGIDSDVEFEFKPLRVLGAVEEEQVKASKQARILARYTLALSDSEEVGQELAKEKLTSIQTKAEQGLLDDHPAPPNQAQGGDAGEPKDKKDEERRGEGKPKKPKGEEE